jgi:sorbitol/mannitol transport system permease protein
VTLGISLFHWNIMYPDDTRFAWFENFQTVAADEAMRAAIKNSVVLTSGVVFFSTLLGLLLALLLDRKFRGRALLRILVITPFLITPVAAALIWKHIIFNPMYGIVNGFATQIYQKFGGDSVVVIDFISQRPLVAIAVPMIWQWTPFMMLIILAGLQSQPPDILEAAAVDGASSRQIFRNMTLPHLRQYIQLSIVLGTIYIVQSMDFVFTITQGGPGSDSTIIPYQIYLTLFRKYEFGEAAAAGVIVIILTIILSSFAFRLIRNLLETEK